MRKNVAERLDAIVTALERDIKVLASCEFHITAGLLRMARLDLVARMHGISDRELQAFAEALEKSPLNRNRAVIRPARRKRRETRGVAGRQRMSGYA